MTPPRRPLSRLRRACETFSMDLRSLAAFRIGLGAVLLASVLLSWTDYTAFFGLESLLSRIDPLTPPLPQFRGFGLLAQLSPHLGFAALSASAFAFLIGWHARAAGLVAWLLLVSLNAYNPLIINSGDKLLALLLFWAWLLPIDRVWSWDAASGRVEPPSAPTVCSPATAGLFLQGFFLYFSAFLFKLDSLSWTSGYHLTDVLNRLEVLRSFGAWMGPMESLHPWMTWSTMALQGVGALALFAPARYWHLRSGIVLAFTALQAGMGLSLFIGIFPVIGMCALIGHLPGELWHRLGLRLPQADPCPPTAPRLKSFAATVFLRAHQTIAWIAVALLVLVNYNDHVKVLDDHLPFQSAVATLNLRQHWNMFSRPTYGGKWYVLEARLANGSSVDLLRKGAALDWELPYNFTQHLPSRHWRKLICERIHLPQHANKREPLLHLLVDQWNLHSPPELQAQAARFVELRYPIAKGNLRGPVRREAFTSFGFDDLLSPEEIDPHNP